MEIKATGLKPSGWMTSVKQRVGARLPKIYARDAEDGNLPSFSYKQWIQFNESNRFGRPPLSCHFRTQSGLVGISSLKSLD